LVTGAVLAGVSRRQDSEGGSSSSQKAAERSDRLALFANASFGLAALSAITSFTLFMTHKNKRRRERAAARVRVEAFGAGASATLRF
jgi:hypothetical protein